MYIVSGAVRDRDVSVALSGLGADELFGGYPSFNRAPRLKRILDLIAWLPSSVRRNAAYASLRGLAPEKRSKLADLCGTSNSVIELTAMTRRTLSDDALRDLGFNASQLGLAPSFLPEHAYDATMSSRDAFQNTSRAEISLYMGNTLLRDADVNSMAHSLEVRVPFLGIKVVECATSLSGSMCAPPGTPPKHLLRRIAAPVLPQTVMTRKKKGFSLPFGEWIHGPLRDQSEAAITTLAECEVMNASSVRQAWSYYVSHRDTVHWSRPMSLIVLGSYLARLKALASA